MKKLSLFLVVTIQLLVIISHVHSQKHQPALMWYVLSWPPTFCNNLKNGKCKEPIPQDIFTLHGLWPADANGKTISCPREPDPDWDKLFLPREATLDIFWPELKENQPKWSIWKHEWQKHGVCIGEDKSEEYFDAAITINDIFITCPNRASNCDKFKSIVLPYIEPKPIAPSPSPSLSPLRFQEETYGTYPMFVQSWAKYIFNG
ncbi:hypothetical protein HAX54_020584 [Datura stramonium]|uniref:Uncharacterized protein n=1 Tax=Datura stramonium TaxID=4076 RepID=A0ABS8UU74_DATST|nr:hypothetical protein [Datura stramonium]